MLKFPRDRIVIMPEKIVKVKVFSDGKDVSSVASIVKQVNIPEAKIYCQTPRKIEIGQNDIVVLLINKFNSNLLTYILDHKDALKNKFILVTRNDSALLVSSLVKLGFTNIFLFPHEIPKFTSYLEEIITNNSYSTVTDTNKESELWGFNSIIGTSSEFLSIIETEAGSSQYSRSCSCNDALFAVLRSGLILLFIIASPHFIAIYSCVTPHIPCG